jgi:ornithine cyclodeaminase
MSAPPFIGSEVEPRLDWLALTEALIAGHRLPQAAIGDTFLYRGADTLLSRAAWIDGLGGLVKTATVFPGNPSQGLPAVNGGASLFDDATGRLVALVDFHLLTRWKTAGDSLLAARLLARPDSRRILIVGAGTVAASMIEAYRAVFPQAEFTVWSRSPASAARLAQATGAAVADRLEESVPEACILCTATMATEPLIRGDWLRPGQHLDLIGAYRPDMREVDDTALRRARIFVDSRATTLDHIGELKDPIARGVIRPQDVVAEFRDIASGTFARRSAEEITLAKNGGGAHLDLMTAHYILSRRAAG